MNDGPKAAFYFIVQLDGNSGESVASFQEVSGIAAEIDADADREGGESRFVHSLPKGVKHPKLVLKRGIALHRSHLVQWCRTALEGSLAEPVETKDLTLCLVDEAGAALRAWSFENAHPVKWTVDSFQSDKGSVFIETIELAYSTSRRTA